MGVVTGGGSDHETRLVTVQCLVERGACCGFAAGRVQGEQQNAEVVGREAVVEVEFAGEGGQRFCASVEFEEEPHRAILPLPAAIPVRTQPDSFSGVFAELKELTALPLRPPLCQSLGLFQAWGVVVAGGVAVSGQSAEEVVHAETMFEGR